MSMNNIVHVGTVPKEFEDWTTTKVYFHGFANLSTTRDQVVLSPGFSCFGHQWTLEIYPGGIAYSDEEYVAVYLDNRSNTGIKIQYCFSVRDSDGTEVVHHMSKSIEEFDADGGDNACGYRNFAKRTKLMTLLIDESLIIEIRMKPTSTANKSITHFIPTNPIHKNILELFNEEETADIVFEVGGEQQAKDKRKKAKTTTTDFHAHRNILKKCAPTLYEMCGVVDRGEITTVSITDVKPDTFKHMIYYTYGGKLSEDELKNNAKDIMNACDKYGVVHLKLEAEAYYVESTKITIDNMMDNLLFADSKNLALLKEAVMDYIAANKHGIMGKVSFDSVPGGLVTDLLAAVARGEQPEGGEEDETIKYNKMRVGTLRKKLDDKGLDVDGSREAMIALLKEESS